MDSISKFSDVVDIPPAIPEVEEEKGERKCSLVLKGSVEDIVKLVSGTKVNKSTFAIGALIVTQMALLVAIGYLMSTRVSC